MELKVSEIHFLCRKNTNIQHTPASIYKIAEQ